MLTRAQFNARTDAAIEVIGVDWRSGKHKRDHFFNTSGVNELTFVSDAVREQTEAIKWQLFAGQETCIGFGFEVAARLFVLYFVLVYVVTY